MQTKLSTQLLMFQSAFGYTVTASESDSESDLVLGQCGSSLIRSGPNRFSHRCFFFSRMISNDHMQPLVTTDPELAADKTRHN